MSCEILAIFLKRHVFSTLNFFSALSGLINSTHFSSNSRTNHLLIVQPQLHSQPATHTGVVLQVMFVLSIKLEMLFAENYFVLVVL
jgi:hypothetical protein